MLTHTGNNFALMHAGSSRSERPALKVCVEINQRCLLPLVPENWVGQRGMAGPSRSPRRAAVLAWGPFLTPCEGEFGSYWQVRKPGLGEVGGFTRSQENSQGFHLELKKLQSLQSSQCTLCLRMSVCSAVRANRNRGQLCRGMELAGSVLALEAEGAG